MAPDVTLCGSTSFDVVLVRRRLGGASTNPTVNGVGGSNAVPARLGAMARFPRGPRGPPRSASLRTIRSDAARSAPPGCLRFSLTVTEATLRSPKESRHSPWSAGKDVTGSTSLAGGLGAALKGDGGPTPRHPPSPAHPTSTPHARPRLPPIPSTLSSVVQRGPPRPQWCALPSSGAAPRHRH